MGAVGRRVRVDGGVAWPAASGPSVGPGGARVALRQNHVGNKGRVPEEGSAPRKSVTRARALGPCEKQL
eukprot:8406779-Lingulodinium_polyedra.AAC.1